MAVLAIGLGAIGCTGGSGDTAQPQPTTGPPCPTERVSIVVTVDQWGDIVRDLAGACGDVTTIVNGTTGDPHEYEPTPADRLAFGDAQLVVLNGLGYDEWAEETIDTLSSRPSVVDAGAVVGLHDGDNPHIWYGPQYVHRVTEAVTVELTTLSPAGRDYFGDRLSAWNTEMQPYDAEIASLQQQASGTTYAATESVFDYMATAIGLEDVTPEGYRTAAAHESEPGPVDVNAFIEALRGHRIDMLISNTQTEGAVPDQIRAAAEAAGVPVVDVTETVPPGMHSFVEWQLEQLRSVGHAMEAA